MGKQQTKKNQRSKSVRTAFSGSYVVRGQRFDVQDASSDTIAQDMADRGYRAGAVARWNGRAYKLFRDHFGDYSLEAIA